MYRCAATLVQWTDGPNPQVQPAARRSEYQILFGIFLIGALVRLYGLGSQSFWGDEAYTAMAVSYSWQTLILTPFDVHPPAYYLIAKAMSVFGVSEVSLRLFSAVVGSLTILTTWAVARHVLGPLCGLVAAAFIATSAIHIDFSQEARSYAFLLLLFSLTLYAGLKMLSIASAASKSGDTKLPRGWLLIYAVAALISLYTHTIALVFLATLNGAMLAGYLFQERRWTDRFMASWLLVNVAVGLAYLPRLLVMGQTANDFVWLQHISLPDAVYTTLTTFGSNLLPAKVNLLVLAVFAIALIALFMRRKIAIASVLLALCAYPLLVWTIGFVKPIFLDRTILPALLGWAILIGAFIAVIRPRPLRIALIVGIVGLNTATALHDLRTSKHADLRTMAAFLDAQVGDNDAVMFCAPWAYFHVAAYTELDGPLFVWWSNRSLLTPANAPQLKTYFSRASGARAAMTDVALIASLNPAKPDIGTPPTISDGFDRVWYVKSLCGSPPPALETILTEADLSQVAVHPFWQTGITEYTRTDEPSNTAGPD